MWNKLPVIVARFSDGVFHLVRGCIWQSPISNIGLSCVAVFFVQIQHFAVDI